MKKILFLILAVLFSITSTVFSAIPLQGDDETKNDIVSVKTSNIDAPPTVKEEYQEVKKGYRGFIEAGYSFGIGDWGENFVALSASHGYLFTPRFFLGVGIGANIYTGKDMGTPTNFPLFINPKVYLSETKRAPYLDAKVGYSLGSLNGFYFNPSVGLNLKVGSGMGLMFNVGYTMQTMETEDLGWVGMTNKTKLSNGIVIRIGINL